MKGYYFNLVHDVYGVMPQASLPTEKAREALQKELDDIKNGIRVLPLDVHLPENEEIKIMPL